jgi:hypothetical protein
MNCRISVCDSVANNLRDSGAVCGLEWDLESELRDSGFLRDGTSGIRLVRRNGQTQ